MTMQTGQAGIGATDSRVERVWHLLVSIALSTLGFFLPFSSAGTSISLAALVVLALARPRMLWRAAPWKEPVMAAGLALLAYIALHTLWTTGFTRPGLSAINHYQELLLAPLLMPLLSSARHRRVFIRSLILGALFLATLYWIGLVFPGSNAMLGARRISAGFGLAVCAFVLVMLAHRQPEPWPARWAAAFLALTVLYAIDGRTGHLVLVALVACAAWVHAPVRWRWAASVGCCLLVIAMALGSSAVSGRLKETMEGAQTTPDKAITSTNIRIELMRVAGDLADRFWLTGAGYANYEVEHSRAALARYGNANSPAGGGAIWMRNANPHNEYLMQLISGGIVALALFVTWLGLAVREAWRARPRVGALMFGVVLAFAIGCVFNSLLLDFTEGHLYMAMLAALIAKSRYSAEQDRRQSVKHRVLVVATRQIGDVLLTTPLIQIVHERWPQARIDVLGFQGTLGMLRGHPLVGELIEVPSRPGLRGTLALASRLWRRYDLSLITDPGDRAHLLGWIAAPCRSGILPAEASSNWLKRLMLDHAVLAAGDLGAVHVTAEKQSLLDPWLSAPAALPVVSPPPAAPLPADVDAALAAGAVVLHAPSMWPYKQWPVAHFEVLVRALLEQGRQVVLTGTAGPRDQECIAPLRALADAPQLLDLSGRLDFNQLVTLFQRAALYIGPDTSVSHLAAATGVPVIAIFGPTNPMRWAPWPAKAQARELFAKSLLVQQAGNVTLLQSGLHCVPCGKAGCEDHRQSRSDCLVDITPERVLEQAMNILR